MIDTTTAAVEIKRYCKETGQMCELATDFGYCQLTACSKQKCGADMRETCNGDSCPIHFKEDGMVEREIVSMASETSIL